MNTDLNGILIEGRRKDWRKESSYELSHSFHSSSDESWSIRGKIIIVTFTWSVGLRLGPLPVLYRTGCRPEKRRVKICCNFCPPNSLESIATSVSFSCVVLLMLFISGGKETSRNMQQQQPFGSLSEARWQSFWDLDLFTRMREVERFSKRRGKRVSERYSGN